MSDPTRSQPTGAVGRSTTLGPIPAPRPGSLARMLRVWSLQEIRLLAREPVAVFFSLVFPIVIYVFIGIPFAEEEVAEDLRLIDVLFPSLIGLVGANLLLMGLPIYVSELRSREVDKRYRAFPLPGAVVGFAITVAMFALVACAAAIVIALVAAVSGLLPGAGDPLFILLNVAFLVTLAPIGFFLGTLPLSTRTIQAMTAAVFFLLFFGSGSAVPLEGLPQLLQDILEYNPLKIWFDQLVTVYIGDPLTVEGILKMVGTVALSVALLVIGLANWRRIS